MISFLLGNAVVSHKQAGTLTLLWNACVMASYTLTTEYPAFLKSYLCLTKALHIHTQLCKATMQSESSRAHRILIFSLTLGT